MDGGILSKKVSVNAAEGPEVVVPRLRPRSHVRPSGSVPRFTGARKMGLRSDHQVATSYRKTPLISSTGKTVCLQNDLDHHHQQPSGIHGVYATVHREGDD